MRLRLLLLSLLALTALVSQSAAADLRVTLHASALLSAREYKVADVATVDAPVGDLAARIGALRLGAARPGGVDYLWRNQIGRVIEATHPELRGRVEWAGAERVELRLAGVQADRG